MIQILNDIKRYSTVMYWITVESKTKMSKLAEKESEFDSKHLYIASKLHKNVSRVYKTFFGKVKSTCSVTGFTRSNGS